MDRLILFRHGKAELMSENGDDFGRQLASGGETESALTGRTLADLGLVPDLVLVSPAVRARQTWAAAAPAFPPAEVRLEEALYHAEASDIRRVALTQGEAFATVMVVGHNPGLHDLTLELFAEGDGQGPSRQLRGFPTAAAAVFLFDARGRPAFDGVFTAGRGG